MKNIPIIISLISFMALTLSNNSIAHASDTESSKNHEVLSVLTTDAGKAVTQFHQAIQAGNKKEARSFLADNVIIYEGGRVERSADDYANHHMLADMKYLADIDIEILEHEVSVLGNIAYSTSRTKLTGDVKGKQINSEGMESMILQKIESKWKIVHIHWSH
ncbi:nuclear transport factor 2 family protein [Colwellia sp. M166]|uniref:YybH family protein n=1 Tax=Colwellia sp. M166 TaxID=2583805 RepID=UPI00211EAD21|nr:nuclear transport factor 2 family protein [Colwellia sp. M166]UUO22918.1 nuclear transport factor 2 family protein [Colwellia sp. M166]|tara:strand:- start:3375 stop:3860 length:486 start_codon:yes stop_codon:yes gene_type:complete